MGSGVSVCGGLICRFWRLSNARVGEYCRELASYEFLFLFFIFVLF